MTKKQFIIQFIVWTIALMLNVGIAVTIIISLSIYLYNRIPIQK